MSEYIGHPILGPLGNQLYRRLEFRYGPFKDAVRGVQSQAAQEGLGRSGVVVRRLIALFRNEAQERLDIIEQVLRSFRLSCSPSAIVLLHGDLNKLLQHIMKQTLVYAGSDCRPVLGNVAIFPEAAHKVFEAELLGCEGNCVGLVQGLVDEVVMAARTERDAVQERDRPIYTINNQFSSPVGSVAQGNSSIGTVHQTNAAATPAAIADAVAKLLATLTPKPALRPDTEQAMLQLADVEPILRSGRMQVGPLLQALNVLGKAEDIALRAPEAVSRIQDLWQMLGLNF